MYHSFFEQSYLCIYSYLSKRRQSHANEEAVTCFYGRSPITNTCNACERCELGAYSNVDKLPRWYRPANSRRTSTFNIQT